MAVALPHWLRLTLSSEAPSGTSGAPLDGPGVGEQPGNELKGLLLPMPGDDADVSATSSPGSPAPATLRKKTSVSSGNKQAWKS